MGTAINYGSRQSPRQAHRWKWILALLVVGMVTTAAECDLESEPTGSGQVPALVGNNLDDAKIKLDDEGFAEPDTRDAVEDRTAMNDSNWVVVSQEPGPGGTVEKKTKIQLGIAKPGDGRFDELLAAGGGQELLAERQRERDKDAAKDRAEKAEDRDPCGLLDGISVSTDLFSADLQEPKKDVQDADDSGYIRVTVACANDDEGLVVHAITSPTPQDAVREANVAAEDPEGFFTTNAFAVERFPDEVGGGGYWVNTEMGSSRLSWSVDYWFIMVEGYFSDAAVAQIDGITSVGEKVVAMFNEIKSQGTSVIQSGSW